MLGNGGFTKSPVDGGRGPDGLVVVVGLLGAGVVPTAPGCLVLVMVGSLRLFGTGGFTASFSAAPWVAVVSGMDLEEAEGTTEAGSS